MFQNINEGAVAIESSRAIAESQGKLILAKRFPRDPEQAYAKAIQACRRKNLAERAFYKFPRGKETVEGPTIRFAEELARCWGNVDYGIKELSQMEGRSEMQAYAWDLETNTLSSQVFTSNHKREVKGTMQSLTSLRDIYEVNANNAARRLRARILAILPNYLVEDAIAECKKTLLGKTDEPLIDRVRKMIVAFEKFGVTQEMIEIRLGRKVNTMNADDLIDYTGIYNSLKDGMSKVSDWFEYGTDASELANEIDEMEDVK
jgi:hypothetical protein